MKKILLTLVLSLFAFANVGNTTTTPIENNHYVVIIDTETVHEVLQLQVIYTDKESIRALLDFHANGDYEAAEHFFNFLLRGGMAIYVPVGAYHVELVEFYKTGAIYKVITE